MRWRCTLIRVTVELIPGGFGEPEHLGTAIIHNDGSGNPARGNYVVSLGKKGSANVRGHHIWRHGFVKNFARKRQGAWDLLYLALRATVGDRHAS